LIVSVSLIDFAAHFFEPPRSDATREQRCARALPRFAARGSSAAHMPLMFDDAIRYRSTRRDAICDAPACYAAADFRLRAPTNAIFTKRRK